MFGTVIPGKAEIEEIIWEGCGICTDICSQAKSKGKR